MQRLLIGRLYRLAIAAHSCCFVAAEYFPNTDMPKAAVVAKRVGLRGSRQPENREFSQLWASIGLCAPKSNDYLL